MTWPIALPDWLPWWVSAVVLLVLGLYGLVFLLMPFSVIGLKGRLDAIEERLEDLREDLRMVAVRMPEEERAEPRRSGRDMAPMPYDPPPARPPARAPARPAEPPEEPEPRRRAPEREEPKLRWPR
jgi:hypothetical protein